MTDGDSGWDVFSIDYHIDGPLSTVITTQAMHVYHRLFAFLWRLKRVEHVLSSSFKARMSEPPGRNFGNTLHKSRILWTEMTHFIYQLEYYILFEVLELSWRELTEAFNSFKDLDDLISAHNHYLNQITLKGLLALNGNEESLSQKLVKLFDIIFRFQKCHVSLGVNV
jgi:gamma-tubulin complex component 3